MHTPVLLKEVLEQLAPQPGQKFIDATINGGGHGLAILEKIQPDGKLLGIEWDPVLYESLKLQVTSSQFQTSIVLVNDSYANLQTIAEQNDFLNADGILLDLGFSSWHMEQSGKGFTFQKDEVLDMRYQSGNQMNADIAESNPTAADILNKYPREEIERILREYGEESFSKSISEAIIRARQQQPIIRTFQLVEIIKTTVPFWYRSGRRLHPATKTFQALRIAVNHELENLPLGLAQARALLKGGGRLAVITFHSLEDRIVKNFFREQAKLGNLQILTKKPIRDPWHARMPGAQRTGNVGIGTARSAKLRVIQKI